MAQLNTIGRSLSSRRAWIEIPMTLQEMHGLTSRSPHGERGLKCVVGVKCRGLNGRSPHGERGLKFGVWLESYAFIACRSPHGERGLKYERGRQAACPRRSLSSRRAWIEMDWNVVLGAV